MQINWEATPLVPAITQDSTTHEVLMLAYMNKEAFELTKQSGYAHYFSRSKQRIWKKGESSGHTQKIVDMRIDCDQDTVLLLIEQEGVACHTGRKSCFFTSVERGEIIKPSCDAEAIYSVTDTLYHTIMERKNSSDDQKSWTKKLLDNPELMLEKINEEANELCVAIKEEEDAQVIYEAADLLYHALVGIASREISPDRIKQELKRRFGTSGIAEKQSRNKH